jgi:hypothetical protein
LIMPTRSRLVGISNLISQISDPFSSFSCRDAPARDLQFPSNPLTSPSRQMMLPFPFLPRARLTRFRIGVDSHSDIQTILFSVLACCLSPSTERDATSLHARNVNIDDDRRHSEHIMTCQRACLPIPSQPTKNPLNRRPRGWLGEAVRLHYGPAQSSRVG